MTTLRYFIADETGELAAMSQARSHRILSGKGSLSEYAGRELMWVVVFVEVERRAIRRVLRVLPFRITFDTNGRAKMMRRALAMERISHADKPPTVESLIRDLELDANYFWVLGESHWRKLSEVLRVSVDDLKSTLYREADDHR